MVRKKKQALDNLLSSGRISQSTHGLFAKEIDEAIAEIERQQKALMDKMNSKIEELERQIRTLEFLLANFEIHHVAGEVEEEVYQRETSLLSVGLETAKHELDIIKGAVSQLSEITRVPAANVVVQQDTEQQPHENVEVSQTQPKTAEESAPTVEEKLPEPPVQKIEVGGTDSSSTLEQKPQETLQSAEQPPPTEEKTANEEKPES